MALLALCGVSSLCASDATDKVALKADYPFQPFSFSKVQLTDAFWAPRIEVNRTVSIPFAFGKCEETGRVYNFEAAAAALAGHPYKDVKLPGFSFDDTDIYKVLEGASYCLSVQYDADLDAYLDTLIEKIAAAQEPDGYLYTARTMSPNNPHKWAGPERWNNEHILSHELYNLGHLYEAAVAHYQATGKRSLLDIAIRTADLLDNTFGEGKRSIWPGHQIVEMGLVKLYRATGEERYLKLARFMLDERGEGGLERNPYNQSHEPVTAQKEAVGHSVRATYMYAGMADVAAITGEKAYIDAIDAIWENCASAKTYLTGGIGDMPKWEGFGENFHLPNDTNYCETCAAIGNVYWNERLFLLHGEARYVDLLEKALYNGVISGVSLNGKRFFYGNPMQSAGDAERQPWFGCACCPGNITRFMASVSGYQYAQSGSSVYVNLFAAGRAELSLEEADKLTLVQKGNYPWDGDISLSIGLEKSAQFSLKIRIPGWARGEAMPTGLYAFADAEPDEKPALYVNGELVDASVGQDGYASLTREWKNGDTVRLLLPMPVRRVKADERVEADRGLVAFQRGPVIYCAEELDNPGMTLQGPAIAPDAAFSVEYMPELLGGISVLKSGTATLVPYCVWNNRGTGLMNVWLPQAE